jgi:hypothetical protein
MNSVGDVPVTPCCTKLNPSLDGLCCAPCSIVSSPSSPRSPLPASLRDLGNQKRPAGFKPFERYIDQLGIIPNIRNMNIYIYLYNCNFIPNMSQYGWTLTTLVVTWFQNSGWNVSSWIGFHQLLCLLFGGPNLTAAYVRRMGSLSAPSRVHTGILKTTTITILFNHKADHETHIDILHTLQSMNAIYIYM